MNKAQMALLVLLCMLMNLPAGAQSAENVESAGEVLTISFWGDSAISETTQEAVERFASSLKNVTPRVNSVEDRDDYAQWLAGAWEKGPVGDVVELDMEMLRALGADALGDTRLMDLEAYEEDLDLGQFSYLGLVNGTANGQLSAVPISMTSHLLFWNASALEAFELKAPPEDLDALIALAGSIQKEGVYPLAADAESRVALLVTYLQSLYGQAWIDEETKAVSFSVEQVTQGIQYLNRLEKAGVWPKLSEQGDILQGLSEGRYLGCWAWGTQAEAIREAMPEESEMEMTAQLSDWAPYDGGFQKTLRMFAIPKSAKDPLLGAKLIAFLLHSEKGNRILADVRGTPISKKGYTVCQRYRLLDKARAEVNRAALSWARYPMPLGFDAPMLVEENGVYEQVFFGLAGGILSEETAAAALLSGIKVAIQ